MSQKYQDPFVTVVSVGIEDKTQQCTPKKAVNNSEYITVLTIGNEETKTIKDVTEEVIVYRLPGERLGFGLKFEGGTKAHEFVKRLFIQSCAPDSPASRVQSSWGQLVEGDEVLEIDSIPVNTMTRIDCVRFLKDSNVAIKLLVKHCFNTTPLKQKSKSSEDLPVIISTEEKKPPPVPPRKLHRKLHKSLQNLQNSTENVHDNIVLTIKQQESFSSKSSRLQSPRNSFRKKYSPDVSRRLSDGSLGPPDAEVYLDLISQESTQSLSESDDTGSTISTVLDRFASFPTTTTSSFAGSLPSTPTSIQKQLDLSYIINDFPEDELLPIFEKKSYRSSLVEENNNIVNGTDEDNIKSLQEIQQTHFSDQVDHPPPEDSSSSPQTSKRPVVIPRSRDKINKQPSNDETTLPRLVDFVPKSPQKDLDAVDTLKRFLESERFDFEYVENDGIEADDMDYNMDPYSSKWLLSSHLSTIGEDEEEQSGQEFSNNFSSPCQTPRVTIETAEAPNTTTETVPDTSLLESDSEKDNQSPMEIPPSDSRQPPDGHEFPDFIETTSKVTLYNETTYNPVECATKFKTSWSEMNQLKISTLDRSISSSNCDLRPKVTESDDEKYDTFDKSNLLHNRSQSLIDVSIFSKENSSNKWNTLAEQRKRRLSKLKGLVIPETPENDVTPLVNIPEIRSITTSQIDLLIKPERNQSSPVRPSVDPVTPLVLPTWSSNTTLPKYSPAFKRKSLQVYPVSTLKRSESSDPESSFDEYISKYSDSTPSRTTDDPKSLESIASPTRSDCSFEYSSFKTVPIKDHHSNNTKDFGDSDNDSAVSSSQSSYNSRSSPPPSPSSEDKLNGPNRMLKPFSVEAINRKNILASAKCRSGKDIKIGSPVIQRKTSLEEDKHEDPEIEVVRNNSEETTVTEEEYRIKNSTNDVPNNESVVLKDIHDYQNALINEPVVLEVHIERPAAIKPEEKLTEKPIPTKRSSPTATPPKENKTDSGENRLSTLLGRHTASSILEKRNKPVNIQSLRANFENSNNSMPVFPKNYKTDSKAPLVKTPPELANGKPIVTTRRRSEEFLVKARRKSDDKLLFKQISQEEIPKLDTRRLSNSSITSISSITKEESTRTLRTKIKSDSVARSRNSDITTPVSPSSELRTIELSLDQVGGSLGITLAGGVDYESKNISIHRIRYGSVAYQDGRLKKGDRIISINGFQTAGMTHSEATELLKQSCTNFTIVIEESIDIVPSSNLSKRISSSISSLSSDTKATEADLTANVEMKKPTHTVTLVKDGAGLGFSIEGGKDSPKGDVPLVVKKIFTGGAAEKCGELQVGDHILSMNGINFQNLSRIEAWSQMKKIPEGVVKIEIFR